MADGQKWQCDACFRWYGFLYGPSRHNPQCKSPHKRTTPPATPIEIPEDQMFNEFQLDLNCNLIGPVEVECQEAVTVFNGRDNGRIMVEINAIEVVDGDSDEEIREIKGPAVHVKQSNLYCEPTADNTRVNCPNKCGQTFATNANARRHAKKCDGAQRADLQRKLRKSDQKAVKPLVVQKRQRVYYIAKKKRKITENPLLSGASFAAWKGSIYSREDEVNIVAGRLKVEEIDEIDWKNCAEYEERDMIEESEGAEDSEEEYGEESGTISGQLAIEEMQDNPCSVTTLAESQSIAIPRKVVSCVGCRWSETRKTEYVVPCPTKTRLDEETSLLLRTTDKGGMTYFVWSISCLECIRLQQRINRWICQSRFDDMSGNRLCTANKTCTRSLMDGLSVCSEHHRK